MIRVDPLKRRSDQKHVRPSLRLVFPPTTRTQAARPTRAEPTHTLTLTFSELALIYKSLQAAKTLGALPPQDELLNDTIQIVDQELRRALYEPRRPFQPAA